VFFLRNECSDDGLRFLGWERQTSFDRTTRFIIFWFEEAWLVDLFDWIETGLVWLADGAAWRRLLIFDKNLGGWAAAEMCQSNNTTHL
jgi:hypothetical protein